MDDLRKGVLFEKIVVKTLKFSEVEREVYILQQEGKINK